jgi:hypothetical protein
LVSHVDTCKAANLAVGVHAQLHSDELNNRELELLLAGILHNSKKGVSEFAIEQRKFIYSRPIVTCKTPINLDK